jgi:hypothetical protein
MQPLAVELRHGVSEDLVGRFSNRPARADTRRTTMPSTTRTLAIVAAAGLALAATVAGAAPASAATRTFQDAVGDVAHGVDVRSVTVVNEKNVRVVVQHDDLVRSFRSGASMTVFLDTDRSEPGPEYGLAGALFQGSDYALLPTVGDGWKLSRRALPLECSYISTLDYAADVTRIRISRGCLERPGEVRVAVRAGGEQQDGDVVRDWLDGRRSLTPWVQRG